MGCECLNKKSEEPEVKKEEKKKHVLHRSDSAIENEFNIEEYENVILYEKNEYEDKITDLDYRFIAISDELWGKKTEEYKQNIRNNVVYTLMSEPDNNGDTGLLNDVFNDIKIEVQ